MRSVRDDFVAIAVVIAGAYYAAVRAALVLPKRRIFREGDFAAGLRWSRVARVLWGPRFAYRFLIPALEYSGRTAEAVALAERWSRTELSVGELGACVNAFINGGRYRRALEIAAELETRGQSHPEWGLLQVNLAEAELNLGRSEAALERLNRLRARSALSGIAAAAEGDLRAWICAHLGRTPEALAAVEAVRVDDHPPIFHPEHHFALAAVYLAKGDTRGALAELDLARPLAVRASSVRNEVFLRARCLAAAGDTPGALAEYQRGAAMAYVGQGGDALLAWGDLLARLDRHDEARRVWQLAIERDAESGAAAIAEARLAAQLR
jgi:tetratricopeptide (TPR) repeat protein